MKTLNTIQTLSKVGRILSKVIFIISLVGGILCLAGIVSLAVIPDGFKLGGVTVHSMIESNAEVTLGTCYAAMAVGAVMCAGEAVLCKLAGRYFTHELEAGTPFTFDGAKEMIRLGIFTICVPIISTAIASLAYAIMKAAFGDVADLDIGSSFSVGLGVMFIIAGLLCRHGAEISQGAALDPEE